MNDPDRPLRIAIVHPFRWPEVRRGGERYVEDLSRWLAAAGHGVDVLTAVRGKGRREVVDGRTVRLLGTPTFRRGLTTTRMFGPRVLPALLARRYDVVHAMTPTAALAARASGARHVFTALGNPTPAWVRRGGADVRLGALALRHASVVAALSKSAAENCRLLTGQRVVVLPPGLRSADFPPEPAPRTGSPRLLFASALDVPSKGLPVLLSAFAEVLQVRRDARLVLCGPGDPAGALASAPPSLLEAVEVLPVGTPGQLAAEYRRASVTVLPSTDEAFGMVLLESLACGTPVVGSSDSGQADVLAPSVGRSAPYGDVRGLAAALVDCIGLAADPATPARCVEHARRWDWDRSAGPAHVELYRSLVSASR